MSELVVPVRVDALWLKQGRRVVGPPSDVERLPWFDGQRDRNGSVPHVASAINAPPFGEHQGWLEPGVHLHWTLPDALTRGANRRDAVRTEAVDDLWFAPAPNRWVVMLRLPDRDAAKIQRIWLVESDHVHPEGTHPPHAIAYPLPGAATGSPPYVFVGRQIELDAHGVKPIDPAITRSVPATSLASRGVTLTALGPGDPLFAAHYPSCRSVFGFHEPVAVAEEGEPRHYTVLGWYREVGTDPLARLKAWLDGEPQQALSLLARHLQGDGAALKQLPADPASLSDEQRYQALKLALRERFGWGVDDAQLTSGEGLPAHVLCVTSITVVPGREAAEVAPSDAGRAGIGSSGAEALAALLIDGQSLDAAQQDRLVQALAATDLSRHPLDHDAKLAEARHNEQFHAERGHAVWVIRAPERHDTPGQRSEATLPDELAHELNLLNLAQETFDRAQDRIAGLRQALFADWHQWMSAAYPEGDADPFAVDVDALRELIERTRLQPLESLLQQAGHLFHGRTPAGGVVIADQRAALPVDAPAPAGAMAGDSFFGETFIETVARGERLTGFDLWLLPDGALVDVAVVGDTSSFAPRPHGGVVQSARLDAGEFVTAVFGEVGQVAPHLGIGRLGFETNRQRRFGPWGRDVDARTAFRIEAPPGQAVVGLRGRQRRHLLAVGIVTASPLHMVPLLPDAGNTLARRVVEQYRVLLARLAEAAPAGRPFTLGVAPGPRFWRPNDPVLVLDDPVAQASTRHGTDGRGQPDGLHPCLATGVFGAPSPDDYALWLWPSGPPAGAFVPGWMGWIGGMPVFTTPAEAVSWHPIQLEWEAEVQPLLGASTVGAGRYPPDLVEASHTFPAAGADLEPVPGLPCAAVGEYVAGRTMLNPAAGRLLQSRLPDVPADLPLDPVPLAARARPDAPPPMVLTLGGFHDQLLLRQREPQIAIADPIGLPSQRAFTARVHHAMGGLHPASPDDDGVFHPIRCGEMLIERLRVIDSFGRTQNWRPATLLKTLRMQPADGAFDRARLPLRLTQAARLDFRWLSAAHSDLQSNDHPATSPVCGWLVPDELGGTLEVYGRDGRLLGSVGSGDVWAPAPGDPMAPRSWREIDAPALRRVLRWLTGSPPASPPADAVGEFVDLLDEALERIDPQDAARHPARAMLIGRPLAVVRARLALVLQQPPVPDPSMTALRARLAGGPDDDHGLSEVRLPVRLGELGQHNDGLCGYWIEQDDGFAGNVFHTPHGLDASPGSARLRVVDDDEQVADFPVRLTPNGASTVVTMLVDPRGVVHAACGVLPVKSIAIPPDQYVEQLAAMRVTFPVAPVLTAPDGVALPLPAEPGFAWSWIERSGDEWLELPHHPTVHRSDVLAGFGNVGAALWDLLVAQGRIVQQRDASVGLLMPGARDVPASAFTALNLTPAAVERGLRSLARGIEEADTAARYQARAVVRDGWLQLQPAPLPADGSAS